MSVWFFRERYSGVINRWRLPEMARLEWDVHIRRSGTWIFEVYCDLAIYYPHFIDCFNGANQILSDLGNDVEPWACLGGWQTL